MFSFSEKIVSGQRCLDPIGVARRYLLVFLLVLFMSSFRQILNWKVKFDKTVWNGKFWVVMRWPQAKVSRGIKPRLEFCYLLYHPTSAPELSSLTQVLKICFRCPTYSCLLPCPATTIMSQRREQNSSDLSTGSEASSITRNANIAQRYLSATELQRLTDTTILERSLSLKSVISTASSFSQLFQTARNRPNLQQINQIGVGLQGVIFEQVGKESVLKKQKPGNEKLASNLRKEYTIHRDVSDAFERYQPLTNSATLVPKPFRFIPKNAEDSFWEQLLPKLPLEYRTRDDSVLMQRILPLPKVVRRALITKFITADVSQASALLADQKNKHCLARVYLGKKNGPLNPDSPLRNFPLYLDSMKQIGIDTIRLASALGTAYATLHWGACVNGDDVEFVFGTTAEQDSNKTQPDFQRRAVCLFLLDFGQCDTVDLSQDREAVYQAFKGAMVTGDNQWFIPRPTQPELFAAFKEAYSEAGRVILADKHLDSRFDMKDFMQQYEEYAEDFLL